MPTKLKPPVGALALSVAGLQAVAPRQHLNALVGAEHDVSTGLAAIEVAMPGQVRVATCCQLAPPSFEAKTVFFC